MVTNILQQKFLAIFVNHCEKKTLKIKVIISFQHGVDEMEERKEDLIM